MTVANITLTGDSGNNFLQGDAGDDTLNGGPGGSDVLAGGAGNDLLDGGAGGTDVLIGGAGNDTYTVNNVGDVVVELSNEGTDLVKTSITYTLTANVENLTIIGSAGGISATGNDGINILLDSSSGSLNTLDGGVGADTMTGNNNGEYFIVDNLLDIVNAGSGTDTVFSSANYSLATHAAVENLTLTGSAVQGTGNGNDNIITGNNNGNQLDGGGGADSLIGGTGSDTFIVDQSGDHVTGNGGVDVIQSSTSWDLSDISHTTGVDRLTLTGTSAIDGTGNGNNNNITGNDQVNTIDGGAGQDNMSGAGGNDVFIVDDANDSVDGGNGTDTIVTKAVSWDLHTNSTSVENLTLDQSGGNLSATGDTNANTLTGNSGDNFIDDGGAGAADHMIGNGGDDTFIIRNTGDVVTAGAGVDAAHVYGVNFTMTDGSGLDNLNLNLDGNASTVLVTGNNLSNSMADTSQSGHNTLAGGAGADTLVDGGASNTDTLDGGTGADTMTDNSFMGYSADTFIVDDANDIVSGISSGGIGLDTIRSSITWDLGDGTHTNGVNALVLTGTGNNNAFGTDTGNDTLTGNSGNNTLDGRMGDDTMAGASGNDTYIVDSTFDVVTEASGGGNDTISSNANFDLSTNAANVENLILTGTAFYGHGNDEANVITGNTGLGNTLDGGAGADFMTGGAFDDLYYVDNTGDSVFEQPSGGHDTVNSSVTYTLSANVEDLVLSGYDAINGTGNDSNNAITGNNNDNTLNGGIGADTLSGGCGDDTYIVDNPGDQVNENAYQGNDTVLSSVTFSLGSNVENLTLTGTSAVNGTGNELDNVLTGNSAVNVLTANDGNDTLDGGGGADTMAGGLGDDTYTTDGTDIIIEFADEGDHDTVNSGFTFNLSTNATNVENLNLTGTGDINGTGNASDNVITGNSGANSIDGGLGGSDSLNGGDGNDTITVNNTGDSVDGGDGTDTIHSSMTWNLGDTDQTSNVENLSLYGSGNIDGTGTTGANVIIGNDGNNVLDDGGAGANDSLSGGLGNDTYNVNNSGDVVTDTGGTDSINTTVSFTLGTAIETMRVYGDELTITATGNDNANTISDYSQHSTSILLGLGGDDFLSVESDCATTTTLDGGLGADTMQDNGRHGNVTFIVDNTGDTVQGDNCNPCADTILSSITWDLNTQTSDVTHLTLTGKADINGTGTTDNDVITGNSGKNILDGGTGTGNDTLDGGAGVDTMNGRDGDDTYYVDVTGDVIIDSNGHDTVYSSIAYTLTGTLEDLFLTGKAALKGTGNNFDNHIVGNDGANLLTGNAGNDTLDGGHGTDSLVGGAGDDVYYVDVTADKTADTAGHDIVHSTATTYTIGAGIEELVLDGNGDINGTGNTAANVITGNCGNNVLNGGTGADNLFGGGGNDTYVIDVAGDVVHGNQWGHDLIQTTTSHTMEQYVEDMTFTGTAAGTGTGNELCNTITGSSGINTLNGLDGNDHLVGNGGNDVLNGGLDNDFLDGGIGKDTLTGGAGDDVFHFSGAVTTANADVITDFTTGSDNDVLDLSAILTGADLAHVTDFVQFTFSGVGNVNTVVSVDVNGAIGGLHYTQIATLTNFTGFGTDEAAAVTAGNLILQTIV